MSTPPLAFIRRLELAWRHGVAYPFLKRLFRNTQREDAVDIRTIASVLILRYDRLGDMVVTTPILRALRQSSQSLRVGVFASEANAVLLSGNPNVDDVFVLYKNWVKLFGELRRARRVGYSVVLNFIFNRTSSAGILANIVAPHGLKVGQGDEKYRFYFNKLMKLERRQKRMVETLDSIISDVFGGSVPVRDHTFELYPPEPSRRRIGEFLILHGLVGRDATGRGRPFVVFNISATDSVRKLSWGQIEAVIQHGAGWQARKMVLISAPGDLSELRVRVGRLGMSDRVLIFPEKGGPAPILDVAALIGEAQGVLTPDTAIVHFASAMKTPLLALYTPLQDAHEWFPVGVPFWALMAESGHPASDISVELIISQMDDFIRSTADGAAR